MKHKGEIAHLSIAGIVIFLAACAANSPPVPKASDPAWSPDSQQIVYVCFKDGPTWWNERSGTVQYKDEASDICVMNADGTNKRRLVRDQGVDSAPVWSPDGKTIAFTSAFTSAFASNNGLYLVSANGGQPQRLFSFVQEYRWSPDGNRIAFIDCRPRLHGADSGSDLYIIDKDGQNLISVENPITASLAYPRWSPDGRQLAYVSTLDPQCMGLSGEYTNSLMVANVQDTFHAQKIIDNLLYVDQLMWLDRETLAYTSRPEKEAATVLYTIDVESGLRTRIRTEGDGRHYTWAPDGTSLAYAIPTATSNVVYVQDRSSGRGIPIWELTQASIFDMKWSPNSQWLLINVYERLPPMTTHTISAYTETIWAIGRNGTFAKRLTPLTPGEPDP